MFHPLLPDLTQLKDADLTTKIADLNKKYVIAARAGNGSLASQVVLALDGYRAEQQRRIFEKSTMVSINKQDKDLGDLINVN